MSVATTPVLPLSTDSGVGITKESTLNSASSGESVLRLPVAMLIDLDDTIISYSTYAEPCWKRVCHQAAGRIDRANAEELYRTLTEIRTWFWADPERHRANRQNMPLAYQRMVHHGLRRLGINDWELAGTIAQSYHRERKKTIKPFPGALETLRLLRANSVRTALVTNGGAEPQREKIRRFNLAPFFDAILIEGECGYGTTGYSNLYGCVAPAERHPERCVDDRRQPGVGSRGSAETGHLLRLERLPGHGSAGRQ